MAGRRAGGRDSGDSPVEGRQCMGGVDDVGVGLRQWRDSALVGQNCRIREVHSTLILY